MTPTRLLLGAAVLVAFLPSNEASACVSSKRSADQLVGYDAIKLVTSGFPSQHSGAVATAAAAWNNPNCNVPVVEHWGNGLTGPSFPQLVTSGSGLRVVTVVWNQRQD